MPTVRRVAILCLNPWEAELEPRPYSYGAWRILASLRADPRLADVDIRCWEGQGWTVERWVEELASFQPDLIAASLYIWSIPVLAPAISRYKRIDPSLFVVAGGSSARPVMFAHPPFDALAPAFDALAPGDGEGVMRELCRDPSRAGEIPGLLVRDGDSWRSTGARPTRLDEVISPLQMDLAPDDRSALLQTFLGCPMGCSFCAWGEERESPALSVEWLSAELSAIRAKNIPSIFSVDAGMNLNRAALRNLLAADAATDGLAGRRLTCQVYPSWYGPDLEAVLERVEPDTTIGLQSADTQFLKELGRPSSRASFERVLDRVRARGKVTAELILGLPGDTPEGFARTLRYALDLGVRIRVYYCLVLPDALMSRGGWAERLTWDPISLELRSGPGWSPKILEAWCAQLDDVAEERGGYATSQWPYPAPRGAPPPGELGSMPGARLWVLPGERRVPNVAGATDALVAALLRHTEGAWRLVELRPEQARYRITLEGPGGQRVLHSDGNSGESTVDAAIREAASALDL